MFLSLDPISAMHLGLTNDPNDVYRAELMSRYILNRVPNNILEDSMVFNEQVESAKDNDHDDKQHAGNSIHSEPKNSISDSLKGRLHYIVGKHHEQDDHAASEPDTQLTHQPPVHHAHPHTGLFSQSTSSAPPPPMQMCSTLLYPAHTHKAPTLSAALPSLTELFIGEECLLRSRVPVTTARVVYDQIVTSGCDSTRLLLDYLDENKVTFGLTICSCLKYKLHVSKLNYKSNIHAAGGGQSGLGDDIVSEEVCFGQYFCSTNLRPNYPANIRKSQLRSSFSSKPAAPGRRQVVPEIIDYTVDATVPTESRQHTVQSELASYDEIHDEECALRKCGCWQAALEHLLANKVSPFYCCQIVKALKIYLK
ncbi:hypothetical protein EON65_26020 [archaeon]|nr:MAG: hypothetical protein EON65_26020 [archaeon]